MLKRTYLVKEVIDDTVAPMVTKFRLVEASSKRNAIKHCVQNFSARIPTQSELISLMEMGVKVEREARWVGIPTLKTEKELPKVELESSANSEGHYDTVHSVDLKKL